MRVREGGHCAFPAGVSTPGGVADAEITLESHGTGGAQSAKADFPQFQRRFQPLAG